MAQTSVLQAARDRLRAAMARHEQGDIAGAREAAPEDLLASVVKEDVG